MSGFADLYTYDTTDRRPPQAHQRRLRRPRPGLEPRRRAARVLVGPDGLRRRTGAYNLFTLDARDRRDRLRHLRRRRWTSRRAGAPTGNASSSSRRAATTTASSAGRTCGSPTCAARPASRPRSPLADAGRPRRRARDDAGRDPAHGLHRGRLRPGLDRRRRAPLRHDRGLALHDPPRLGRLARPVAAPPRRRRARGRAETGADAEPWAYGRLRVQDEERRQPYRKKYTLDAAQGALSTNPVWGTSGGAVLAFSDLLGNDQIYVSAYSTQRPRPLVRGRAQRRRHADPPRPPRQLRLRHLPLQRPALRPHRPRRRRRIPRLLRAARRRDRARELPALEVPARRHPDLASTTTGRRSSSTTSTARRSSSRTPSGSRTTTRSTATTAPSMGGRRT